MVIKSPDVAVITVYFNRANYVKDSVRSLLAQTYPDLRIVIVDDFSSDNTFSEIVKFASSDPRVTIIKNSTNKGFTATLIDTIKELDVKYVAIHGSGDISHPLRIFEQVKYLRTHPNVGVLSVDLVNLKGRKFHQTEITLKHLMSKNRITHGSVMFRRDVYVEAGGYRSFFSTRQDKDLWLRMSLLTDIHFLPKKLYELTSNKESVSGRSELSEIPTLLSVFAIYLIRERLVQGSDSLDLYGIQSGLIFDPRKVNGLLIRLIWHDFLRMRFVSCENYLDLLHKYNRNIFSRICINFFAAGVRCGVNVKKKVCQ